MAGYRKRIDGAVMSSSHVATTPPAVSFPYIFTWGGTGFYNELSTSPNVNEWNPAQSNSDNIGITAPEASVQSKYTCAQPLIR
jgi:hypothetical protein